MTNAGWYPDPAGAPDTYRYWDGQSWSQMTTSHPPAEQQATPQAPQQPQQPVPPAAAATQFPPQQPQQPGQGGYGAVPPTPTPAYGIGGFPSGTGGSGGPGGYGQQQWSPQPTGGSGGSGKTIGIVIAAVLTLVLLGVGGFFGVRALTGDDDGDKSAADPSSESSSDGTDSTEGSDPTEASSPTESASSGSSSTVVPTGIQCTGGKPNPPTDPGKKPKTLSGGGLTIPLLAGYEVELGLSDSLSFADNIVVQYAYVTDNWVSEYGVGGLAKANGFSSTEQAAEIIMQCLTMNDQVYSGFESRTDLKREAVTLDGMAGYSITSEIRVNDARVTVEGDVTTVIVLDTGDADSYGLYIGVAPIGDAKKIAEAEGLVKRIQAD